MNSTSLHIASCLSLAVLLIQAILFFPGTAAFAAADAYPFNKGSSRFSLQVGSTRAFDRSYTAIGLGAGYYLRDGLELGLDADAWFGSTPRIYRASPGLRAVFYSVGPIKPYAGVFYRRTFIENVEDQNEAGGRSGITVMTGARSNFSVGLVYDRRLDCDRTVYSSCSEIYTELSFAVLF
ncbi:MAG: hypothetical protein A2078_15710 [Nitrospirae bacterium GWC2_57_9]|nr:MAG: hypothetical protein A2078_15710 [Nitrospirae bacterium GWC2_57_9]